MSESDSSSLRNFAISTALVLHIRHTRLHHHTDRTEGRREVAEGTLRRLVLAGSAEGSKVQAVAEVGGSRMAGEVRCSLLEERSRERRRKTRQVVARRRCLRRREGQPGNFAKERLGKISQPP